MGKEWTCPGIQIEAPETYLRRILDAIIGDRRRQAICALLTSLITALLAYHFLVISGVGNPDALSEGLVSYTGYDWALACGRWAMRYMAGAAGNVVVSGVWITLYALCTTVSTVLLLRLWDIKGLLPSVLIAVILLVNPTVIEQSLLQYMFLAWGLSSCLCVMFVFFNLTEAGGRGGWIKRILIYPWFVAIAFGLYQACLGTLCTLVCMSLILWMLDGKDLKQILFSLLKLALSLLIGLLLYFVILRAQLLHWSCASSGRLNEFSLSGIFAALSRTLPNAYKTFFAYFYERALYRLRYFELLFGIGAVFFLFALFRLVRKKAYAHALLAGVLALGIPICANISDIVFPYNKPVLIMQYASILTAPFVMALINRKDWGEKSLVNLGKLGAYLALFALCWGYVVSANATYKAYEISWRYTHATVAAALDKVYALPDYEKGEPIAFAGIPNDRHLRERYTVYKYAYGQYPNFVFWEGYVGLQGNRKDYLMEFFGVNAGDVPYDRFLQALESPEYREMNCFPLENSVRRIDGLIIIKFEEEFQLET